MSISEQSSEDILLVDKPKGISSFDVIRILRNKLHIKKMGHAGTLDPLASGLMIIGVNKGTKKLAQLVGLPKTYEVTALLGKKTTTGDMDGEIIDEITKPAISEFDIKKTLEKMVGTLRLEVPKYSAVKQGGVPLYKKARQGKKIIVPIRDMEVFALDFHEVKTADGMQLVTVTMDVASGVYVRSVVEELGRRLKVPATTYELRRTKIGDFDIADAMELNN